MNEPSLIARLAAGLPAPLTVVDVGCRWGPAEQWSKLPNVRLYGFDPDPEECERLNRAAGGNRRVTYVPAALGAAPGEAKLHLAAEPACSSLYPPDEELAERRPGLGLIKQVGQEQVTIETLDAWCSANEVERVDFLKIDTQGAELDVLKGAEKILGTVRAVEVEVEFNPIYLGQPLFSDIDIFLREHGFVLWRMGELTHYGLGGGLSTFKTTESLYFDHSEPSRVQGGGGQLFWANAFYVRGSLASGTGEAEWPDRLADAVVAGGLGFWDLAAQSASLGPDNAPREVAAGFTELVASFTPAPSVEAPLPAEINPKTELRPYQIPQYAAEVGARLAEVLASDPALAIPRGGPLQDAALKPALPPGVASLAAAGSRRVIKRVHLDQVEFDVVLDPELDDWKTAAFLADRGHLADAVLVELVLKLAGPGDLVLDIGAYFGGISLPAAASGREVVAIEPWDHACNLLRNSAARNRFGNLKVLRAAATEEAGMAEMFPAGLYGRIALEGDAPVMAVPTIRIDDLVAELGGPKVCLVRMDVEGSELRVLEGMTDLLQGPHPPAVLFEADEVALRSTGSSQRRLLEWFADLDYDLYRVGDRTLSLLEPGEWLAPAVCECLAVRGRAPAVPRWTLVTGGGPQ
ncbi:MAG TPA: FkbM family methyltransferase [Actinomycetota bacterium]|nr:FkbM family methyltransferase [Actinomycetota bacterium]